MVRAQPVSIQRLVGLAPVVAHPSATPIRKLKKVKVSYQQDLELPQHPQGGPHSEGVGGSLAGPLLLLGSRMGAWGSQGSLLMVKLKHRSGNLKRQKGKNKWPQRPVLKSNQELSNKAAWGAGGPESWLFIKRCGWQIGLFQIATFEADAWAIKA